jgi:hypothetical protein
MSIIQQLGDWTLQHPDGVLVCAGIAMGIGLGTISSSGVYGLLFSGLLCGLFTFLIAHIKPHEFPLGPHE